MADKQTDQSEPAYVLTHAQLKDLLASGRPSQEDRLAEMQLQAELQAKAHQKLTRPENPQHPGISAFSRPEGETVNPKGNLRCKTTWGGTLVFPETLTAEEFDLLNSVEPGEYMVRRPDNSAMRVAVVIKKSEVTGQPEQVDVNFQTARSARHNLPSMVDMLRQLRATPVSAAALVG
jgi:hypothetical protein